MMIEHRLSRKGLKFTAVVLDKGANELNPACAAVFGTPEDGCLVRVHSRCVYGEIFGSDSCDCRAQLDLALEMIIKAGTGVIVYLDQEGRGSGLLAKAKGYQITQNEGLDTYASYAKLGLKDDSRSYEDAAALLRHLNLRRVSLLTNNPDKVAALEVADIEVNKIPSLGHHLSENHLEYLVAKEQHGHVFVSSSSATSHRETV
jgi:3,4-dihydroxy 2-butanone 4-phosphate synthase/GTP cyclohydrolase II